MIVDDVPAREPGAGPVRTTPFPTWPRPTDAARRAVTAVLDSGEWWQTGTGRTAELERWLADYHDAAGALAVTNGTNALELALRALGVGPGEEVIVPALTFISTATAVTTVGATPVPCDVDPHSHCIEPTRIGRLVTPRTRAVIPVHLAGIPADMPAVLAAAREHGLAVVEDCAQAFGAEWQGRRVGTYGDLAIHSFHANKLLPAGEGGALIVRSDQELLARAALLANCGRPRGSLSHDHVLVGSNHRMTEFQAALLLSQVDDHDALWVQREKAGQALTATLTERELAVVNTPGAGATRMAWYAVLLRLPGRPALLPAGALAGALEREGIPAKPVFPPFYRTAAYATRPVEPCPHAESASAEFVLLHHRLLLDGQRGVDDICAAMHKIRHAAGRSWPRSDEDPGEEQ